MSKNGCGHDDKGVTLKLGKRLWLHQVHQDQDCHLVDKTSNNVIAVTNTDVDVAANDVEIPMLRSTIDAPLVSTRTSTSRRQDWHLV